MNNVMSKFALTVAIIAGLIFGVPLLQLVLSEFTQAGNATHDAGIIYTATQNGTAVGGAGTFELAFWRLFPIIVIIIMAICIYRTWGKRDEGQDTRRY
jgi:hypothetical protein